MPIKLIITADDGQEVQEVTDPKGKVLRYQTGFPGKQMTRHSTLTMARTHVGLVIRAIIDSNKDGQYVFKVKDYDGNFIRYEAGVPGVSLQLHTTLVAARAQIGKATLPKKRKRRGSVIPATPDMY